MSNRIRKPCTVLLLALASLLAAAPASAQVVKATVKIEGMV